MNGDRHVMAKHSAIYPTQEELESVQNMKDQATRTLRGVMRVGLVAKGLLLKGDLDLELVLLCKDKPTINLLERVYENLVTQIQVRLTLRCRR
ncbi:hypothetical protein XENOCAPTIV_001817 [Xenoophorus captivus]|uniref:DZF domain-containing protein n=1 Tax=Xenoophorus captivus TaxID=1517983 RepID=A0ABV0S1B2_9TELE